MDDNQLTAKLMEALANQSEIKNFRELIDQYLEKAWHNGYDAGLEDEQK